MYKNVFLCVLLCVSACNNTKKKRKERNEFANNSYKINSISSLSSQIAKLKGIMYEKGIQKSKITASRDDLVSECNKRDPPACFVLGTRFIKKRESAVEKDKLLSIRYFGKSCDLGMGKGCYNAALILLQKIDEKSIKKANVYLEEGCRLKIANSCMLHGILHGGGWKEIATIASKYVDEEKALRDFKESCRLGSGDGCALVATMYYYAKRSENNIKMFRENAKRSCDYKSGLGCFMLAAYYHKYEKEKVGMPHIVRMYEKSCTYGSQMGCANCSIAYEKGDGVKRDIKKALYCMKKECDLGGVYACGKLKINNKE